MAILVKRRGIATITLAMFLIFIFFPGMMPTINAAVPGDSLKAHTCFIAHPLYQMSDPLTPSQVISAYNLNSSTGGAGITIAIVDAYDDPTIQADLASFCSHFNLPQANFVKHEMASNTAVDGGWALEISLDVEWAHAVAPNATILLVEAASNYDSDLFAAINYATGYPGVRAVSMSWGGSEFSGEAYYDSYFTTPGIVFFVSSGDNGAGVQYPACSPNVVSVGGTTLNIANGKVTSETAWSGSGGGVSAYESRPAYQTSYGLTYNGRAVPDISYDADPSTGVYVYDSTPYDGGSGWWGVGGTSAGAPQWAAIQALGLSANNNNFYRDAKSASNSSYFRDITAGSNGYSATTGYDLVTGLGSPLTINFAQASPSTITTQLNATSIALGQAIRDNATVTGSGPVPTGYVLFQSNATGSWVTFANITLLNGVASSTSFTPTHLGTYYFNATYSGDGNYAGSTLNALETLIVGKTNSTVTTALNASSITLGSGVYSNATVKGSYGVPTGFVLFQNNATGSWVTFDAENLTSGMTTSAAYTPTHNGTYFFQAVYGGDGNYTGSTSALENITVGKAPSTARTNLNSTAIALGGTVHDTTNITFPASIPPFPVPTGTVTFQVKLPSGRLISLGTASTIWDNNTKQYCAVSASYTPTQTGTYYFNATYSGDGNYAGSTLSVLESLIVGRASTITTALNASSITLGSGVYSNATVKGSYGVPTGFVLFQSNATGSWVIFANVTLKNGVAPFANFTPPYTGTFFFQTIYSGDGTYNGSQSDPKTEILNVGKANPSVNTMLNATTIDLSQSVTDTATMTGVNGIVPTGTTQFYWELSGGSWAALGSPVTLVSGSATSPMFQPNATGTYYFLAVYSGDSNYVAQNSSGSPVTLNVTQPARLALVLCSNDSYISYDIFNTFSQTWGAWFTLSSGQTPASQAAALVGNSLYFVVKDTTGGLWYSNINLTSSAFSGWTWMSGGTPSDLTLTSNGTCLALVVRSNDSFIFYNIFNIASQTWDGWFSLPSGGTPDTPAAAYAGSSLYFVVKDTTGDLWYSNLNGNGVLSGWTWVSGGTPSRLQLVEG